MIGFKLWSVLISFVVLFSLSDSKPATDDQLSEIDRDLASILNEADTTTDTKDHVDSSVLTGFIPVDQTREAHAPSTETDDDMMKSKLKRLLETLTKDENKDDNADIVKRLGHRFSSGPSFVRDIPVPKKEEYANDDIPREIIERFRQDPNTQEKIAKALLEELSPDTGHNDDDAIPKELLDDLKSDSKRDEAIPKALLDDLKDPDTDPIPNELLEHLIKPDKREKVEDTTRVCGDICKILMDELESRMTTIAKRGDKIPKRMFDLWRKYRTRRENRDEKSNLKM